MDDDWGYPYDLGNPQSWRYYERFIHQKNGIPMGYSHSEWERTIFGDTTGPYYFGICISPTI